MKEIKGIRSMGSCQCGDVVWKIVYNTETMEFSHGNSNWSNRGDHHIPYVGNALKMVQKDSGIIKGWKYKEKCLFRRGED